MDFQLKALDLSRAAAEKCDVLLLLLGHDAPIDEHSALGTLVAKARRAGDLGASAAQSQLVLYRPEGVSASRVILVALSDNSATHVRTAVLAAVQGVKSTSPRRMTLLFAHDASDSAFHAAMLACAEASYVYTTTKSKQEARSPKHLVVGVARRALKQRAFERACASIVGIEFAKEWGNRPGNHCTPTMLANAARDLAKIKRIQCEILGLKEVQALGMGAFVAVAQGSAEPLRFIVLRYQGAAKAQPPTVLVGKGITFDTGGVSLKPAAEMDEMKFDMCGAASVLGVFRALGELQAPVNVIGLIPSCENMNDGRAIKPGDVVTSMAGQTIEILNTDAEGRLILCDALTYAKRFAPAAVIDIATLTGACVVALGGVRSGLFANNEALAQALEAAGEQALDRCWRMPLDDDYAEGLKTSFADVANVAGRAGGAITAAKFLQRFVDYPWAHLDIAGTAWRSGASKGSTGRPVGLLLNYLTERGSQQATQPTRSTTPKRPPRKVK